jgi:hypothetical protein
MFKTFYFLLFCKCNLHFGSTSVVDWGTMLQAGRSRVRFLMVLIFPAALLLWGTRKFTGTKGQPAGAWGWQSDRHEWAYCLENVGAPTFHNWSSTACYRDRLTLPFPSISVSRRVYWNSFTVKDRENQDNSICIATGYGLDDRCLSAGRTKRFFSTPRSHIFIPLPYHTLQMRYPYTRYIGPVWYLCEPDTVIYIQFLSEQWNRNVWSIMKYFCENH